ncbi:cytosine permease [Amycolatopsis sp. A1MSW2902]|uniref:cytosine permease n=1 Tax=Amycolatopsis sp. A1MSW2902 TaxID=687413 RepID=UPI00307D6EC1
MSVDTPDSSPRTPVPAAAPPKTGLGAVIEDYALERVPESARRGGWGLLWNTAGAGSTLVVLSVGAAVTLIAGVGWGFAVGAATALFGGGLGWAVGHVSRVQGTSSTLTARYYGLGSRGSVLASLIFAVMIVSFLALENAMLYNGTLFLFGWAPSLGHAVLILGVLTVLWLVLPTFGISLVQRTSGLLTAVSAVLFVVVAGIAVSSSGRSVGAILGSGPGVPGFAGQADRVQAALALLAGIAGALALLGADFARYARTSKDVGVMAVGGSVVVNLLVPILGTLIVQAGSVVVGIRLNSDPALAATQPGGSAEEKVAGMVSANPGAFFVVLAGAVGFALVYAAQAKAQVVNAYSASLSLTNLVDGLTGRSPGRLVMLVVANAAALAMIAGGILNVLASWLDALGILTTSLCTLMIVDYFVVRRRRPAGPGTVERVNWAGVLSLLAASALAETLVLSGVTRLGFLVAIATTAVLYPALRLTVLPPGRWTRLDGPRPEKVTP